MQVWSFFFIAKELTILSAARSRDLNSIFEPTECFTLSLTMSKILPYHCFIDQTLEPKLNMTTSNTGFINLVANSSLSATTKHRYLEKVLFWPIRNTFYNLTMIHTISYMNSTASPHRHLPNVCISIDFNLWLVSMGSYVALQRRHLKQKLN